MVPREHKRKLPCLLRLRPRTGTASRLPHSLSYGGPGASPGALREGVHAGRCLSLGHLWRLHPRAPSEETKAVPLLLLLLPQPRLQEPEEKRIVQELLETEKAYVARLHLLDQASGQGAPTRAPAPGSPHPTPALPSDPLHQS